MTTRYKIAEQVMRIVSGGDYTEDSNLDIREIMLLVDQERNNLIKTELMDWAYTKSTATAKGELEVNGAWLSESSAVIKYDPKYTRLCFVDLADLGATNHISLPNDMGIYRVASYPFNHKREKRLFRVGGGTKAPPPNYNIIEIRFQESPKVLDEKYRISFEFEIKPITLKDGTTEEYIHKGVRKHNIEFDVYPKKYDQYEHHVPDMRKAIMNSPGFQKFVKDYDVEFLGYDVTEQQGMTNDATQVSNDGFAMVSTLKMATKYGAAINNFGINGVIGSGAGNHGASDESNNNIGFGWRITNPVARTHDDGEDLDTEDGLSFVINGTIYSADYISPKQSVGGTEMAKNYVLRNAHRISREQDILVRVAEMSDFPFDEWVQTQDSVETIISFEEIESRGGFDIAVHVDGNAWYSMEVVPYKDSRGPHNDKDMSMVGVKPTIYTRMPSGGNHNSMYDRYVNKSGRDFYYIETTVNSDGQSHPRIYLYKKQGLDPNRAYLTVSYIGTSEKFRDHDPYPVPADYERMIIKNLVEMFSIMKKAQDDVTNDNID